jgi:hypothetical protein
VHTNRRILEVSHDGTDTTALYIAKYGDDFEFITIEYNEDDSDTAGYPVFDVVGTGAGGTVTVKLQGKQII